MKEWNLQEQDDGEPQAGGDVPVSRKQFVEEQLSERYKPREVRELLARYGDKAEVALEAAIKEHNEMVNRLMRKAAELEYDKIAAQKASEATQVTIKALEAERDDFKGQLDAITAKERTAAINAALEAKFNGDKVLATRHRAYLRDADYSLDLDGEKLMVVKGDKRQHFDTVVNDAFYATYPDARPTGDTPLPPGNPPKAPGDKNIGLEAAELYASRGNPYGAPKGN